MSEQQITLVVDVDYQLPDLFHTLTPVETGRALSLAAAAYTSVQRTNEKSEHKALYATLQKEAAQQYEPELQTLQKKLQQYTDLVSSLKSQLTTEESARLSMETRIRDEERRNREDILSEKSARITSLETQLRQQLQTVESTLRESSKSLTEGFQSFKEQILKTATGSQTKGKQGEGVFAEFLHRAFGAVGLKEEFTLDDVGKEGHQGDLHMKWRGHKILWEVKNYSRNVDTKEVNKFLRDMEENRDISLGVMVSLTTGITGHQKAGGIDLEELRDGRMCIYVNTFFKNEDPVALLQSLKPFMESFLQKIKEPSSLETTEETTAMIKVQKFEYQRTILLKLMQSHQESMRKFKLTIANAKKRQDQIWSELTTEMRESEHQVKLLLETLLDDSLLGDEDTAASVSKKLPSYVFRHEDISMYNEKERKFVQDTVKLFEFHEDYKMSAKIAKDFYREVGYSEDFISAIRPRIFAENVWEKGSKEIFGMRKSV